MDYTLWQSRLLTYAQTNWLKIVVFGILCFIFLKKDLTFQLNLNAPSKVEETIDDYEPSLKSRNNKSEKLTEAPLLSSGTTNKSGFMDKISFSESETQSKKQSELVFQTLGEIDEWMIESYIERFSHVAVAKWNLS